jgi:hypothetical protein
MLYKICKVDIKIYSLWIIYSKVELIKVNIYNEILNKKETHLKHSEVFSFLFIDIKGNINLVGSNQ